MPIKKGTIGIIHIDEDYQNATHLQEKEKGFRSYFNSLNTEDYNITTVNLNYKQSESFNASLCKFLEKNPNINGLFVTISKSYVVVEALKEKARREGRANSKWIKKGLVQLGCNFADRVVDRRAQTRKFHL